MWLSAGQPCSGTLFHIQRSRKAKYKSGIREAYINYESRFDDVLVDNIMQKKPAEFLKA